MSSKGLKIVLGIALGVVLACGLFASGIVVGSMIPVLDRMDIIFQDSTPPVVPVCSAPPDTITSPEVEEINELFLPFWESWDIVHEQFVDQLVDDEKMMQGAIQGMLQSLGDPNTSYMDPEQYQQANMRYEGSYEGIGAYIDTSGDYVTVISTMDGSPAEAVGLKPGDEVLAVDGEDMTGLDGTLVIQRILPLP